MRILVACEFSGIVRDAFTAKGHYAISCDLLQTETPGAHYVGYVEKLISDLWPWDMLIGFPPCTNLCVSGARWFKQKQADGSQQKSIEFFRLLANSDIPKICIENPIGIMSTHYRKPDQIIQPWMFGHGETKATCLWLKGLPPLKPTEIVSGRQARIHMMAPSPERAKERSRTYQGIAQAMADQWGE